MAAGRQYRFVSGVLTWMVAGLFVLAATEWFTNELFFVVSLTGVLVVKFTSAIHVRPPWRKRVRWIILVGIAGFPVILTRRTIAVLAPEVV